LSFVSASVAFLLFGFGFGIGRIGISSIDVIIAIPVISFVFTVLVSGGICHATNLIDGLHGLAIGVSVVMLLGLASISISVNDVAMARICLGGVACLLGLLVFNFPLGKVFLGDAGAYSIGHVIAWIGVLIIARNPSVAPFSVLLVFFWPLTEMAFAIVRRKLNGKALSSPDRLHFHQLIMRGLELMPFTRKRRYFSNPAASLHIVGLSSAPVFVAQNLSQENAPAFFAFIGLAVLFVGSYLSGKRLLTYLRQIISPDFVLRLR
jgi:UDP-GlcNAc:undecaprenyl-phosphate/decaprenyl-phosphate GlcNAc-1-phosphate transferase